MLSINLIRNYGKKKFDERLNHSLAIDLTLNWRGCEER
jgi:hypothetical protein